MWPSEIGSYLSGLRMLAVCFSSTPPQPVVTLTTPRMMPRVTSAIASISPRSLKMRMRPPCSMPRAFASSGWICSTCRAQISVRKSWWWKLELTWLWFLRLMSCSG